MILITELLENFEKKLISLSVVAKKHGIPVFFLRNIASDLRRAGFIKASEGKNGGYGLSKNPSTIQFGKVMEVLAQKPLFSCCQNTKDGKCKAELCRHGFSPRRLANEFFEGIYNKTLEEIVHHPRSPSGHLGGG